MLTEFNLPAMNSGVENSTRSSIEKHADHLGDSTLILLARDYEENGASPLSLSGMLYRN
jgi:hypothetical protein